MLLCGALDASNRVSGWLSPNEQKLLFTLAKNVPEGKAIVELGSWMGKSTIMLAVGSLEGSKAGVYAVDFFELSSDSGYDYSSHLDSGAQEFLSMFLQNIREASLSFLVTPIKSSTLEAAKIWTGPSVYLLFFDAGHNYQAVHNDFLAWVQHCIPGARLVFHDYRNVDFPGVSRFVDRLVVTRILTDISVVDTILHGKLAITELSRIKRRLGFCPAWFPRFMAIIRRIPRAILRPRAALRVLKGGVPVTLR